MNAVFMEGYGAPHEVLVCGQTTRPKPLPHEILIKVSAIGINPLDCDARRGYGRSLLEHTRPLPAVIGQEVAGTVEAVGEKVMNYKPGDAVWASLSPVRGGAYAEYVCVTPAEVSPRPRSLSAREAAALPFVCTTLWAALADAAQLFDSASLSSPAAQLSSTGSPLSGAAGALTWLSRGGVHLLSPLALAALNSLGKGGSNNLLCSLAARDGLLAQLLPSLSDPACWTGLAQCLSSLATALPQQKSGALDAAVMATEAAAKLGMEQKEVRERATEMILRPRPGKEGAVVFIDGASGALGTVAVQLLTHLGFRVWATCGPQSVDRLRALGCERVWTYAPVPKRGAAAASVGEGEEAEQCSSCDEEEENEPEWYDELSETQEVDVYLDARGGERTEEQWEADEQRVLDILKPDGGHYLTLRGPLLRLSDRYGPVQGIYQGLRTLAEKKRILKQQYGINYDWVLNYPSHEALSQAAALAELGIIRPVLDSQPLKGLTSIADAHLLMEQRLAKGKVVVEL